MRAFENKLFVVTRGWFPWGVENNRPRQGPLWVVTNTFLNQSKFLCSSMDTRNDKHDSTNKNNIRIMSST